MIIVAVSGGVDSMVLLDKLYKSNEKIVIAHVNYQKRIDSYLDQLVIEKYIADKDIILETLIIDPDVYTKENFQAQARTLRYDFFLELAKKYDIQNIYLAHHFDDYLETYLFQKIRDGLYNYWGLASKSKFQQCYLYRPLLHLSKKEIREYALENKIEYCEDSSNQSMIYTRNRLRKIIKNMNDDKKHALYQQSLLDNKLLEIEKIIIRKFFTNKNVFDQEDLLKLDDNLLKRILFEKIGDYHLSGKYLNEIIRMLKEVRMFENSHLDTTVAKKYGKIFFIICASLEYNFLVENDTDYEKVKKYFDDNFAYQIRKPSVSYPYKITNYSKDDLISLGIEAKKFNKKMMKNKIPYFLRGYLPIVKKGEEVIELI